MKVQEFLNAFLINEEDKDYQFIKIINHNAPSFGEYENIIFINRENESNIKLLYSADKDIKSWYIFNDAIVIDITEE